MKNIRDVIKADLCISCGACYAIAPDYIEGLQMDSSKKKYIPITRNNEYLPEKEAACFAVCPGKGYNIEQLGQELFPDARYSFELGRYQKAYAVRSTNDNILKHSSSGGIMTELAIFLLELGIVDGVTSTKFQYGNSGPIVDSYIATTREEILMAQGSKYAPTSINGLISTCKKRGGKYFFIGLPCQVAALKLAAKFDKSLTEIFPYTMSNFCGGYKDYRSVRFLISQENMSPSEVTHFQFRGNGQPGYMIIKDASGRTIERKYPNYLRGCPIPKEKRCVYCVDATGELADFSCGDAWIERFTKTGMAWSIILLRSQKALEVFNKLSGNVDIQTDDITEEEIIQSQKQNLTSKKYRQRKRMIVSRMFGITIPKWDVKLPKVGSYMEELYILLNKKRKLITFYKNKHI